MSKIRSIFFPDFRVRREGSGLEILEIRLEKGFLLRVGHILQRRKRLFPVALLIRRISRHPGRARSRLVSVPEIERRELGLFGNGNAFFRVLPRLRRTIEHRVDPGELPQPDRHVRRLNVFPVQPVKERSVSGLAHQPIVLVAPILLVEKSPDPVEAIGGEELMGTLDGLFCHLDDRDSNRRVDHPMSRWQGARPVGSPAGSGRSQ